ncbi:hypothetical protein [Lentzea atacamensis]|uniref:hypothetical protein n=1 Tax=Lentzea atacamensis TaxID=531938 RepID=UPI0011B5317A|nr:hypothetical protein [Lentzea atacamensis]
MSDTGRRVSLDELQSAFESELETDIRVAAETAYALAFRYRNEDVGGRRRFDLAKVWAVRAIEILDSLPSDHVEHVVSTRASVGGIPLPELLHAGLVRQRLADVLV